MHCGPIESCGMNRAEAYKALRRMENGDDDARADFKLVENVVESGKSTWAEAVDSFGRLMRAAGGNGETTAAQRLFRVAASSVRQDRGRSLAVASQIYCQIHNRENGIDDSVADFELVRSTSDALGLPFGQVAEAFLTVLSVEGGNGETAEAQRAFREITSAARDLQDSFDEITAAYREIRRRENGHDDARGNFSLVVRACQTFPRPIGHMAGLFNEILRVEGGDGETADAKSSFQLLMQTGQGVSQPFEDLHQAYRLLRGAENGNDDARGNFELVARAAREHECSVITLAREFNDLLRGEGGNGETTAARAAFRAIYLE